MARYGLFELPDSDSDSDSKPYGYIVYAEYVSTDSDSDLDPFPIVSAQYRNLCPTLNPNPSPAMEISH